MASDPAPRQLTELETLLAYVVELLESKADLEGAKVLSDETADLTNQIAVELAKLGLAVIVAITNATPRKLQTARVLVDADVTITVTENVLLNRKKTGKSALYIVTRILALLNMHGCTVDGIGIFEPKAGLEKLNVLVDPTRDIDDQPAVVAWRMTVTVPVEIEPRSTTN